MTWFTNNLKVLFPGICFYMLSKRWPFCIRTVQSSSFYIEYWSENLWYENENILIWKFSFSVSFTDPIRNLCFSLERENISTAPSVIHGPWTSSNAYILMFLTPVPLNVSCWKREILRISLYAVRMWENTDHKNSDYGHFSRSASRNLREFTVEIIYFDVGSSMTYLLILNLSISEMQTVMQT